MIATAKSIAKTLAPETDVQADSDAAARPQSGPPRLGPATRTDKRPDKS